MYIEAGKRAEQAGFDLLEVSAGMTLCHAVPRARFNRRKDKLCGSFETGREFSSSSCMR